MGRRDERPDGVFRLLYNASLVASRGEYLEAVLVALDRDGRLVIEHAGDSSVTGLMVRRGLLAAASATWDRSRPEPLLAGVPEVE